MIRILFILTLLAAGPGCSREEAGRAPARAVAERRYVTEAWALPAGPAAQPHLASAPDGALLLSWIEKGAGTQHALRFARSAGAGWSSPRTIAEGTDWFVNWADIPHLAATPDGALWAHWLRKSAAAPYAYDVVLSRSADGGASWAEPVHVNDDGTPTEHGFVSLWPVGRDRLGVAWLDGRNTGGEHTGRGAMTLRSASFDGGLARHGETELDASVCDCCQTDVAATERGTLLVYRDRADGEIRDIATSQLGPSGWTAPRIVHADRWTMPACPVNGPSVAAEGSDVAVAWYTAADGTPQLRFARSGDAGDHFGTAVVIDRGAAVLGRVRVARHAGHAWVAWLREDAGAQSLWLARMSVDGARVEQRMKLADVQGRGRGTGLPQMVGSQDGLHIVWTDVVDGSPQLRGLRVHPAGG
jgi:hypothetical protein